MITGVWNRHFVTFKDGGKEVKLEATLGLRGPKMDVRVVRVDTVTGPAYKVFDSEGQEVELKQVEKQG